MAIVNAYCIAKIARRQQGMKEVIHLGLRKALYKELFKQGQENRYGLPNQRKEAEISKIQTTV